MDLVIKTDELFVVKLIISIGLMSVVFWGVISFLDKRTEDKERAKRQREYEERQYLSDPEIKKVKVLPIGLEEWILKDDLPLFNKQVMSTKERSVFALLSKKANSNQVVLFKVPLINIFKINKLIVEQDKDAYQQLMSDMILLKCDYLVVDRYNKPVLAVLIRGENTLVISKVLNKMGIRQKIIDLA